MKLEILLAVAVADVLDMSVDPTPAAPNGVRMLVNEGYNECWVCLHDAVAAR